MTAWAYYNEWDGFAAETLRTLIERGMIAPGVVDTRSIEDVTPDDLREFTQCHFFAGLGLWSKAARDAGWPDDRELWSASCPCQPFSSAGAREGFADERHLWPATHWLIQHRRPTVIVGEQVAGADAKPWFDLVCDDMGGVDYTVRAQVAAAAGYGAPMVSERLYWMASARGQGLERGAECEISERIVTEVGSVNGLASPNSSGLPQRECDTGIQRAETCTSERQASVVRSGMAAPHGQSSNQGRQIAGGGAGGSAERQEPGLGYDCGADWMASPNGERHDRSGTLSEAARQRYPADSASWVPGIDGKWRPTEPGLEPLAHGMPRRVDDGHAWARVMGDLADHLKRAKRYRIGAIKALGNAIVLPQATEWMRIVKDGLPK